MSVKGTPSDASKGKIENYQIAEGSEVGRGAFSMVYQAFNVANGDFVAIKSIPVKDMDADILAVIEREIELMKKLNHPNIVKYIDSVKSTGYLYIVLEYMENGSLSDLVKKYGNLSEILVANYTTQILQGLRYLHDQGVLHRDVKGANILTSKDKQIKLADFGLAIQPSVMNTTNGNDVTTSDVNDIPGVVGTPYWMAPEIIEMDIPSSACDIWSLGCTIIELLTGKPPYFDLTTMAALFRIVRDDHPPIPEFFSDLLVDFLMCCFQKDPSKRGTAASLLTHPWLQVGEMTNSDSRRGTPTRSTDAHKDSPEVKPSIVQFQPINIGSRNANSASPVHPSHRRTLTDTSLLMPSGSQNSLQNLTTSDHRPGSEHSLNITSSFRLIEPDKVFSSFLFSIYSDLLGLEEKAEGDDDAGASISKSVDMDDSELDSTPQKLHDIIQTIYDSFESDSVGTSDNTEDVNALFDLLIESVGSSSYAIDNYLNSFGIQEIYQLLVAINTRYLIDVNSLGDSLKATTSMTDFSFFTNTSTPVKSHSQLACNMQLRVLVLINIFAKESVVALEQLCYIGALPVIVGTIECLCNQLNSQQIDRNDSTILTSMVAIMAPVSTAQIAEKVQIVQSHLEVLTECSLYVQRMATCSQFTAQLFIGVGGINVIMKFLSFGSFIRDNHKEKLCGGADISSLSINHNTALRLLFTSIDCIIGALSYLPFALFSGDGEQGGIGKYRWDTRTSFRSTSSSSLSSIANKEVPFPDGLTLLSPGTQLFSSNKMFCKVLIKSGILPKLAVAFDNLLAVYYKKSSNPSAGNYEIIEENIESDSAVCSAIWTYIIRLSALFLKLSKHEANIKDLLNNESIVLTMVLKNMNVAREETKLLVADLPLHAGDNERVSIMELMVLFLKKLSTNPISQVPLEKAGCLAVLVPLLYTPDISRRCLSLVLETLYNLCRVNKKRQEQATMYGIIPFLISESINLDQSNRSSIATHMLCDLANASATTRGELTKNNVVQHFANMMDSKSVYSTLILNSLSIWIQNDAPNIERILLQEPNINILITLFTSSSKKQMNLLHVSFTSIFCNSSGLCNAVGRSDVFVKTLIERLAASDAAIITLSYLKILQMLHLHYENPIEFAEKYQLITVMSPFIKDKSHVYVFELAIKLCADFCTDFKASLT